MYDFAGEIAGFHTQWVRLTNTQRADMRSRRQTNLDRIKNGLKELDKPAYVDTFNQGGYAQKTMTQPPEADQESRYDIDLGVVFEEVAAAGPRTTRGWVRDAIARKATNMKNAPETKRKCVRVIYADGYQCDFPVFRRRPNQAGTAYIYELSSGDDWVVSDPRSMNEWIEKQVSDKSPEQSGSYQLRRIIRLGKFFAKTHAKRLNRQFPSGLVATALFIDSYVSINGRDDEAFRETLRYLSTRSEHQAVWANGVQVSDTKDVERIRRLIEQAGVSVQDLDKLDASDATQSDARKAWKKVFCHSYFNEVVEEAATSASSALDQLVAASTGLAASFIASQAAAAISPGERTARLDAAVSIRRESGGGSKPWSK
jgi:hypothetical protein